MDEYSYLFEQVLLETNGKRGVSVEIFPKFLSPEEN